MTGWIGDAPWWQVYPLGFLGAEPAALPAGAGVRHRLNGLDAWLDYVVDLGCTGLLLGPIFASETHGYDTVDHLRIDPRLGDEDDFAALVSGVRRRGLRLVLDGVFNHVGRSFTRCGDASAAPGSSSMRWLRQDGAGLPVTFEGHDRLVTLDHAQPDVASYVTEVLEHWLDRGVDGWRLDAAYAVPPGFWQPVVASVRRRHPDAFFVGEMIHGDYAAYVRESGLDAVTQYELWKAIWSSLNDRNLYELAWALQRHDELLETFVPMTFVGNHDVTRLASRLVDPAHLGHALAVLFTVGGVPSVYAGDEQGFRGVKEEREGGDEAIRPRFPASPEELPADGWSTYALHQRLIAVRSAHPWLVRARTTVEQLANRSCVLRSVAREQSRRDAGGGGALLTLLNLDDEPHRFELEAEVGELSSAVRAEEAPDDLAVVPPHSWAILASRPPGP